MNLKDWPAIIEGTPTHPRLMNFAELPASDRNRFAERLSRRGFAALKSIKRGRIDPDVLAYEEAHRAFAGWKKQIADALGMPSQYRRYSSRGYVEKLRDWTCELLRLGVNPGDWLRAATEKLSSSPTSVSVKFQPNYLFSDGVFETVTEHLHERGRYFNDRQAGKSRSNAYAGKNDSRALDFLRSLEGFDPNKWDQTAVNTLVSYAKSLASGDPMYIPSRSRGFAQALADQPWIGDL